MSKHRAESAEPLPTLATTLAPPPALAPRVEPALLDPVVAPPALSLAPASSLASGSSPIPAPILTTPRRSRVEVPTPTSVTVACWVAIAMTSLQFLSYGKLAVHLSSVRGSSTPQKVAGLIPGQSSGVRTQGHLTLLILAAGLICVLCLVVIAFAYVAMKRSNSARIALIICAGATAAVSLGPVFGAGSLWWALTMVTSASTAGILAWNGWWYADTRKLRG